MWLQKAMVAYAKDVIQRMIDGSQTRIIAGVEVYVDGMQPKFSARSNRRF